MTTSFTVANETDFNNAIKQIDVGGASAATGTAYTITLTSGFTLTTDLLAINLDTGSSLTIEGNNAIINGGGTERGLFVYSGAVTIDDLTIKDAAARGGAGGSGAESGGGGAGLGGGLFVASAGSVTLSDVSFTEDRATGGAGGTLAGGVAGGGGLGGAGGSAGAGSAGGGGGVGSAAVGSNLIPGSAGGGIIVGAASGGQGNTGIPAGPSGGGGGAGPFAGGGGVGGKTGRGFGGTGGFGGGGGGAGVGESFGGDGGFGGGGGGSISIGGGGGFGGGGGGNFGRGGFGGGGGSNLGGGGLGAGGDIFVQQGGSLTIAGGTLDGGSVRGGQGGGNGASNGQGYGSGIFLQGNSSITFGAGQTIGQITAIDDVITDQSGSDTTNLYNDPGAGAVVVQGAGTVELDATNTYTGGTTIDSGTLELAALGAAGSGAITIVNAGVRLNLDNAALASGGTGVLTFTSNSIKGFAIGDLIELSGATFDPAANPPTLGARNLLQFTEYGTTYEIQFDPSQTFGGSNGTFHLAGDGAIGIDIELSVATTIAGTLANQSTAAEAPVHPFSGVTITDPNSGATDTLTITLSSTGSSVGILSGNGLSGSGTIYQLSGTAAAITSELDALTFTPVDGVPNTSVTTTLALSDLSSAFSTPTVNATTSVIDSDPAVAPTIAGTVANQTTTSEAPIKPFSGVTITDPNSGATDTLTITLSTTGASFGTLSGTGLSGSGSTYQLSGTAATITTELDALSYIPVDGVSGTSVTTTFTLSDQSSAFATATTNNTTSVIDTDPAPAPSPVIFPQVANSNVDEWILANGQWAASAAPGSIPSGYEVAGTGDFTGNGTSDILWFNDSTGDTQEWLINNGGYAGTVELGTHPGGFQIAGIGDFFGNGIDGVLWTSSSGGQVQTDIWELSSNGQWQASVSPGSHPTGYNVVGVGDFTGNGTSDILWQNPTTGDVDEWQIVNGEWAGGVDLGSHPGSGWTIAGIGDFTGNGRDDVLWTNASGGSVQTDIWELGSAGQWIASTSPGNHPAGYSVAGVGDFTGTGTSDILWYNASTGDTDEWLINNGQWAGSIDLGTHPGNFQIAGTGAFVNGNSTSDILWHSTS